MTPTDASTISIHSDLESLQDTIAKSVNSHIIDNISQPPSEIRYAVDEQIQWCSDTPTNTIPPPNVLTTITSITEDQTLQETLNKQAAQISQQAEQITQLTIQIGTLVTLLQKARDESKTTIIHQANNIDHQTTDKMDESDDASAKTVKSTNSTKRKSTPTTS